MLLLACEVRRIDSMPKSKGLSIGSVEMLMKNLVLGIGAKWESINTGLDMICDRTVQK